MQKHAYTGNCMYLLKECSAFYHFTDCGTLWVELRLLMEILSFLIFNCSYLMRYVLDLH